MNTRQILNEHCQKYNYKLPEYYHEYTGQIITSVYAIFNNEKYAINPCHFNTKKEANEQVAKLILNKVNTGVKLNMDYLKISNKPINNSLCEKLGANSVEKKDNVKECGEEKPIVLYSDSTETPFANILDFLIDYRHSGVRLIGFSRILNNKYIAIFDSHIACLDPDHELIWYVANNLGYLKGKRVHIACSDKNISNFLFEKLDQP
jgi:hypothetical protein